MQDRCFLYPNSYVQMDASMPLLGTLFAAVKIAVFSSSMPCTVKKAAAESMSSGSFALFPLIFEKLPQDRCYPCGRDLHLSRHALLDQIEKLLLRLPPGSIAY
uniref:Uncharacterized protein n=1 Tax=Arundo donax TaxID=35708 RepID=A0A0A9C1E9_ARUDO